MISDTERREVAERLREAIGLTEFAEVLGFDWTDDSDWVWNDVSNLVADLIEPTPNRSEDTPPCDRDALLALAEELECDGECDGCDMSDGIWCDAQGYAARRIRKALGVCK